MREKKLNPHIVGLIETLDELSERERGILIIRFVAKRSLQETGKLYRISDERVRELEEQALRKIEKYVKGIRRISNRKTEIRKKTK